MPAALLQVATEYLALGQRQSFQTSMTMHCCVHLQKVVSEPGQCLALLHQALSIAFYTNTHLGLFLVNLVQ